MEEMPFNTLVRNEVDFDLLSNKKDYELDICK